ncbi:MAG: lysozyme [Lachnospiraceae bacterium]|nr:lysozyme [Lachnospiraceae bacterium]
MSSDNLSYGQTITQTKANSLFDADIAVVETAVNTLPKLSKLTQDQFDAISSLVFNVGTAPVKDTSNDLYKALNKDTFVKSEIVTGFTYTLVNGVRNQGLVNRRNVELNLFFGTSDVEYISMT